MQIDVDEIWKSETLREILHFSKTMDYPALFFKCNFFVGPNLVIVNENCYGNKSDEWIRLWKIREPTYWITHEPPSIKGITPSYNRDFTKKKNWIFNHYAYTYPEQIQFKENFYGYRNAFKHWSELQTLQNFPVLAAKYLPWVRDNAIINKYE
jgi:hypothetical protein